MADASGNGQKDRPRACAYCNRSKTKCIWPSEPGEGSCQRCMRLKRECSMPEYGERRKRGPSTRVGQLEAKLDGIMSLLHASRELQQQATPPSTITSPPSREMPLEPQDVSPLPIFHDPRMSCSAFLSPGGPMFEIVPGFRISAEEADSILDLYRSQYSPKFPFVPIAPEITASELFERRPFLFRIIIQIIAPQSAATQRDVTIWVREQIAQHVLIEQDKRLELLQGLLLFISWGYHFNFYIDFRDTTLFQVAVGMVLEAGLNKPGKLRHFIPNHLVDEARRLKGVKTRSPHTLEEMRVVLGVFYLNSLATSLFYHMPMFPYSAYLATCRTTIESAAEYESDRFLSILIRMQQTVCRIHHMFPNPEMDGSEPVEFTGASHMAIVGIKGELEALRAETPAEIRTSCMFDLCYKGIMIRLYEPVIYMAPTSAAGAFSEGALRSEALWFCLEAAKSFFLGYQSVPADQLPYLPCQGFSYFTFALVTATRLLFLSDSDWNPAEARRIMDFLDTTRRLSDHFNQAARISAAEKRKTKFIEDGRPFMTVCAEKLRWIGSWYLSKQSPAADEQQQQQQHPHHHQPPGADGGAMTMDVDPGMEFSSVNFDSEWWEGLLGDFASGQAVVEQGS